MEKAKHSGTVPEWADKHAHNGPKSRNTPCQLN